MTELRNSFTTESNGIPPEYTKLTSNGKVHLVSKGQLNKIKLRPAILNEHAESSREAMDEVDASNILGQIFKASQDNINGIMLTMESAESVDVENFESYADSGELQAVWVETGNPALLETTIVNEGSKSMNLPLDSVDDEWQITVGPTDYTGYTFGGDFLQTVVFGAGGAEVSFFLGDGVNTKSIPLVIDTINDWVNFEINEAAMSDDGGTPDITAITEIGFRVDRQKINQDAYVDKLTATPSPGQVELKLFDCGDTIPVGDGASFDLTNDATQYTELGDLGINGPVASSVFIGLLGGKRLYNVPTFVAGTASDIPGNTILTVGNYYAITINYVDTDVDVYGPDTTFSTNYYENGYAFFTSAENADITTIPGAVGAGTYSDLMFGVFSTQDIWITTFVQFIGTSTGAEAVPGVNSNVSFFAEDSDMKITDISSHDSAAIPFIQADLTFKPFFLGKGGKFEMYFNDDPTDNVAVVNLITAYAYIPPTVNG